MKNKFIRLLVKDTEITLRMLLLAGLIFSLGALYKKNAAQAKVLKQLREKQEMARHIPDLEKRLRAKEIQNTLEKTEPQKVEFTLNGIILGKRSNMTVINGEVYREGDSIGVFTVSAVTLKAVTLRNKLTNKVVILKLKK